MSVVFLSLIISNGCSVAQMGTAMIVRSKKVKKGPGGYGSRAWGVGQYGRYGDGV